MRQATLSQSHTAGELQCPAVLRDYPHNIVGSALWDIRFDFLP